MKLLNYTLPLLLLGAALTGCEERIDDRYKKIETTEPVRTVLIEEYTGVRCNNCPTAHEQLKSIEKIYNTPENLADGIGVIAVGIHIPAFGDPVDQGGFVTPEVSSLAPGQNTAPAARFNRRTDALNQDQWLGAVAVEIVRPPMVTFNPASADLSAGGVTVSGSALSNVGVSDAKLHAWIVEDNIVDLQILPNGSEEDNYNHHAVYRASITGLDGVDIELTRNVEEQFTLSTYPLHPNWNAENLRVVIFITTDYGGVLNATQTNVK